MAGLLLCLGMTAMAAPSVEGDTELTAVTDEVIAAEYTVTSDEPMESVSLRLSYDRDVLTYMTGSGGNNFAGSGGNGLVELSSKPNDTTAVFTVRFRGNADEDTTVEILSCTATVDGEEIDVLTGETVSDEAGSGEADEEEEAEDWTGSTSERASWVIDDRTFYLHSPGDMDGFDSVHLDIQGIDSRVLKHNTLDLYVIMLHSDNGSYRDYFVYNPDTGNVVPYVQMEDGSDTVVIIEPEEDGYVPTRYSYVDMPWGAKYSIPAYKHVIIDGIDEIFDDTNRYLVYGINQEGEKAWYSFDYDTYSIQKFDDVAYQGEQNYILSLEESVEGQKSEAAHLLERYNTDMGRRLTILMLLTILVIVLLNVVVMMYLRMRKMQMVEEPEEDDGEPEAGNFGGAGEYIVGNLEENETDFREPDPETDEDGEEPELEIIDLDDSADDED